MRQDGKPGTIKKANQQIFNNIQLPSDVWKFCFAKLLNLSELSKFRVNRYLFDIITPILDEQISRSHKLKSFAMSIKKTVLLTENNQIFSCGHISEQHGSGFTPMPVPQPEISIVQISASRTSIFVLRADNSLLAYGDGDSGQLGLGDFNERNEFTLIPSLQRNIARVACGNTLSMILLQDGTLLGCGHNAAAGVLGLPVQNNVEYGKVPTFSKVRTGRNWNASLNKSIYPLKELSAGGRHCLAITSGNWLAILGYNTDGQLGVDNSDDKPYPWLAAHFVSGSPLFRIKVRLVAAGVDNSFVVSEANELFSCGSNLYGQLGLGDTKQRRGFCRVDGTWNKINDNPPLTYISQIAPGIEHVVILTGSRHLWSAGNTSSLNSKLFTQFEVFEQPIKQIDAGYQSTGALTTKGKLLVHGDNRHNSIGLGTLSHSTIFRAVKVPKQAEWEALQKSREQVFNGGGLTKNLRKCCSRSLGCVTQ